MASLALKICFSPQSRNESTPLRYASSVAPIIDRLVELSLLAVGILGAIGYFSLPPAAAYTLIGGGGALVLMGAMNLVGNIRTALSKAPNSKRKTPAEQFKEGKIAGYNMGFQNGMRKGKAEGHRQAWNESQMNFNAADRGDSGGGEGGGSRAPKP